MLENRLTSLVWTKRISVFLGIPFWIVFTILICNDGQDIGMKILGGIITCIISIGYLLIRYQLEYQACEAYLQALLNKDFQKALTLGRSYYGYRRNGLKGAAGTYNTIYDEQAISNDINAYSK